MYHGTYIARDCLFQAHIIHNLKIRQTRAFPNKNKNRICSRCHLTLCCLCLQWKLIQCILLFGGNTITPWVYTVLWSTYRRRTLFYNPRLYIFQYVSLSTPWRRRLLGEILKTCLTTLENIGENWLTMINLDGWVKHRRYHVLHKNWYELPTQELTWTAYTWTMICTSF